MIALALLVLGQTIPPLAEQAVRAAAGPEVRAEVRGWKSRGVPGCEATTAEVRRPIKASGWIPVRLVGPGCEQWGWAQLALFVPALVLEQPAHDGQPLIAAVLERELTLGRTWLSALPPSAVAARNLPRGTVLEPQHLRSAGPAIGDEIDVVAGGGAITIVQRGRVIGCAASKSCAQLANGRRVQGTLTEGRLQVELK